MFDTAWLGLSLLPNIGGKTLRNLLAHFQNDPLRVLAASRDELLRVPGIGQKTASAIHALDLQHIGLLSRRWQAEDVRILPYYHPDYPIPLRLIDDEPPTLFVRGQWPHDLWQQTAAIVGTRQPSAEARLWVYQVATGLAQAGYTVISGLAYGIDAAAHEATLRAGKRTVAVLGGGVLRPYPAAHTALAQRLMQQGALLSETAPSAEVSVPRLVARNRIISGLAQALIIAETNTDGGAMHAARFAAQQGKRLFALDSAAEGNQALILQGAIALPQDWRQALAHIRQG